MSSLHHVVEGNLPLEKVHAETWYACTGCGRCTEFCGHQNDVAATLTAGRAEAFKKGESPLAAKAVAAKHDAREARAAAAAEEIFGSAQRTPSRIAFAPGCSSCVTSKEIAKASHDVVEILSEENARVVGDRCCGLPLLDAGDHDGFLKKAARYIEAFGDAEEVVMDDPGCLHALRVVLPRLAPSLATNKKLLHTTEFVALHRKRLHVVPIDEKVRYHDACRLGRGLGIFEPPRDILRTILGKHVSEFAQNRGTSECSGAGGQVPRIFPETAKGIADERVQDHERAGGGVIVTTCASSLRAFQKSNGKAMHLSTLIARALK